MNLFDKATWSQEGKGCK